MLHFTYTDAKGEVTERKGIVLKAPITNYLMADVGELSTFEILEINLALEKLDAARKEVLEGLGLKYRSFNPEKMQISS